MIFEKLYVGVQGLETAFQRLRSAKDVGGRLVMVCHLICVGTL